MSYKYEDFLKKAEELRIHKDYAGAKIELEKAMKIASTDKKKQISSLLSDTNHELAAEHEQYGKNYIETGEYEKAVDELNIASELEPDSKNRERIISLIDEAGEKLARDKILDLIRNNLDNGEKFREDKNYIEAYTEFKEAYEVIRKIDVVKDIKEQVEKTLVDLEHRLVSSYIKKAESLISDKKYEEAWKELEYAEAIVDDFDKEDIKEIDRLHKKLKKHILNEQFPKESKINHEILEKAIERFEDVTDLYFRYGLSDDPYNPHYTNRYEKEYALARAELGNIYEKIGDNFMDDEQLALAFKFYNDALIMFEEGTPQFTEISGKIDVIRKIKRKG